MVYWLPISVFFMASYQSLNYLCNREGRYKQMALSRIFQSSSMTVIHVVGGYLKAGSVALVTGQIIGQVAAAFIMAYMMFVSTPRKSLRVNKHKIIVLAKKYANFPRYLILAHGFNTASAQSPVLFLSALFGSGSAGFYILIQRVIGAPMVIVAGAIGDVFRHEASREYAKTGQCRSIYRSSFLRLLVISIIPFSIFLLFAPELFVLVFGDTWRLSGEYSQILTPMFFLQFITSPLSTMYMIAQKQKFDLVWQAILFSLLSLAFLIGQYYGDIKVALSWFSGFYSLMYAVNGLISYNLACGKWR
jgi:O-antigen/teichoic acid export membrane protein